MIQRNELEESVIGVEWSAADPWTYAALSFNGSLVVATVPDKVKYSIQL